MAVNLPPPYPKAPIGSVEKDEITDQPIANLTDPWQKYFRDQRQYLAQIPVNVEPTALVVPDANDAIGTTTLITPSNNGIFSVEYFLRVITAAATSSSAQVVLNWTDQGDALTQTFTAVTGNTTTTHGWGRYQFQADGGTPITYSVTYASNGANEMHYNLYLVVQAVASLPA